MNCLTQSPYRTQSLLYLDQVEQYLNLAPQSRAVSTALILHAPQPAHLDRQSQFVTSMRRARSMSDLNFRLDALNGDVKLQKMTRQPFSYLAAKASLESQDLQRYKDVAL